MRKISANQLAVLALLVGAVVFASGAALAQDHGHDGQTTEEQVHQIQGEAPVSGETHTDAHGETGGEAHGETHSETHGETHGEEHSLVPHLQNFVSGWIIPYLPEAAGSRIEAFIDPLFSMLVVLGLSLFFIGLSRQLTARKPGRRQMAAEIFFGGLYSLFETVIGPTARRYTPFLGTLFIFIICNNFAGMLPLGHASTSSTSTTFALSILVFFYVQGIALKENGILGYLHHMAGSPKTGMDWGFSILLFPLHLLGEFIKPVSLALRLFGNIFGEDTLVATMVILGYIVVKLLGGFVLPADSAVYGYLPGIPLQLPFYFLGLLSGTIQALVFSLLATVYIALWLPHDDHGPSEAHGH